MIKIISILGYNFLSPAHITFVASQIILTSIRFQDPGFSSDAPELFVASEMIKRVNAKNIESNFKENTISMTNFTLVFTLRPGNISKSDA